MKQPQDFQKKKNIDVGITPQNFLDTLKLIRDEKDLDKIQGLIISIFQMYGLQTDEVAALLFSLMKNVLNQEHNKRFLKERFAIDINSLGGNELEGIFMIQKALLLAFNEKGVKDGKA